MDSVSVGRIIDSIFKPFLDVKYKCCRCKHLLKDAYQMSCGHRFCKACLDRLLIEKRDETCPSCTEEGDVSERSRLVPSNTFIDHGVKREIAKLKCGCLRQRCPWCGLYGNLESHLSSDCEYIEEPCTLGCGLAVPRIDMDMHLKSVCRLRQQPCQYCSNMFRNEEITRHEELCDERRVLCEFCRKTVTQSALADHRDPASTVCSRLYTVCPFGCKDLLKSDNLEKHKEHRQLQHIEHALDRVKTIAEKYEAVMTDEAAGAVGGVELPSGHRAMEASTGTSGPPTLSGIASKATLAEYDSVEKVLAVVMDEVTRLNTFAVALDVYKKETLGYRKDADDRMREIERQVHMKEARLNEQAIRIDSAELATYDGTLLWRISDVAQKRRDAASGKPASIYSHAFYTSRMGYKMCARLYLNGDGLGKTTHVSLFFVLLKGPCDALLKWPFTQKVTLMLLNQNPSGGSKDLVDAFRADPNSSSFRRPVSQMNIASGCPTFCPLKDLEDISKGYVKDDTMFIKIIVDRSGLDG